MTKNDLLDKTATLTEQPSIEPKYSISDVTSASLEYFDGDDLAAKVFADKYALRDNRILPSNDTDLPLQFVESTPDAMHDRLAYQFALKELQYDNPTALSTFREALNRFKFIVPQGSPMYGIGNPFVKVSISNCVVVDFPADNMSGIMESGKDLANLFKRRCVEENTLVWTRENGLIPIKDVEIGMYVYSFNSENKKDVWRKVTDKFKSNVEPQDRIKLKTAEGTILRTSKKHPVLIFDQRGYGFVDAGSLEIGDTLIKPSNNAEFTKTSPFMDCDIAWWIGAHLGDGDANFNNGVMRFRISGDNKSVIDGYADVLHKMNQHKCHVLPSTRRDYKTQCWQFTNRMTSNARIAEMFLETNIGKKCYAAKVPSFIVKNELWWPFIAGLIDTDGWAKNGSTLTFGVCAKEIVNAVGAFLSSRGVRYHVSPYESGRENEQPVYRVTIHQDVSVYAKILPFLRHDKKKQSISDAKLRPFSRVAYPVIPNERQEFVDNYQQIEKHPSGNLASIMCNIKKDGAKVGIGTLNELLSNGVISLDAYTEIQRRSTLVSVEPDTDATEYWDIEVEGTNNFYAGNYGLANIHNCGVGMSLDSLRPDGAPVSNSAGTSTGAWSFANYYSEVCRMIGQNGRRGALMLTMNVLHPDIPQFVVMKRDKTRVTGANVSVMLTDDFMKAVENDEEWICRWPLNVDVDKVIAAGGRWEEYSASPETGRPLASKRFISDRKQKAVVVSYRAQELWHLINESAVLSAEPGLLFWDNYGRNLPANAYKEFALICVNPCVTDDTWIMTSNGPRQVKSLIGKPFVAIVDGKEYNSTDKGFYATGEKVVFEIKTHRGFSLKATENHPVMVETRNGRAKPTREWKNVGDLNIGDRIVLNRHEDYQWDGLGTKDEGWLLGNLLGDGNIQKNGIANLDFWGENREHMLAHALDTIMTSVGSRSDMLGQEQAQYGRVRVSSSKLGALANKFGLSHGNKALNDLIETSSSNFHVGFLKGWFDADGSVQGSQAKGASVRLTSVSLNGLEGAQRMLARLGILSTIYPYRHQAGYQNMPDGCGGTKTYLCQARHELVISGDNILKYAERIGFIDLDKNQALKTLISNYKRKANKDDGCTSVVEINPIGVCSVYDCTIPEISAFDANGLMVHNCAEIGLSAYDSCRLTSLNLKGYVRNPHTSDAYFDYKKFVEMTRLGMRIMDDVVDLEIDYLSNIIDSCDEPEEKELWGRLRSAAVRGRRTGFGMHGLADALACLGLRYDSDEAIAEVDKISETFCINAYDASVNLAIERGAFPAFDWETEKDCEFIKRLPQWLQDKMAKFGRRNISLLTVAPTGSVSIVSQTSSGLEPVFSNFYTRRRKINPSDSSVRVDFVDQNGDKWQEYSVFHHNVREYLNISGKIDEWNRIEATVPTKDWAEKLNELLPDCFVTAPEIDPKRRVEIQGHIQRWIDHGISSTINMPAGTTVEQGQELYMLAWKHGLKGVTIYVDGSRSGVLVNTVTKDATKHIVEAHCPKRPAQLECDIHHVKVNGIDWIALVGLLDGVPYEIFGGAKEQVDLPKKIKSGIISKRKCEKTNSKGRTACYDLIIGTDDDEWKIKDIADTFDNGNYAAQTRMISLSLRHGVPIQFIAEQLSRDIESEFHSFSKVMARVLKQYIENGATGGEKCSSCGEKMRFENGCTICPNCGEGKCN